MSLSRPCLIVLAALALGACGASVRTQVTAFNTPEAHALAGRTVAVAPAGSATDAALDVLHYRDAIAARLLTQGLVVVEPFEGPDLLALFEADIDAGRDREVVRSVPIFGYDDGFGSFWGPPFRCVGSGAGRRCYSMPPRYGVVGYETRQATIREYTRSLRLRVVDADDTARPLYEGTAVSVGACNSLAAVFDPMADALFEDWPGVDGEVRTVRSRADLDC